MIKFPTKHIALNVWLCCFFYVLLAGFSIQLYILPNLFPQLHAGNGLLAGRDWVGFHEQAVAMAQKISLGGWDEFFLRPKEDNPVISVTSIFYYFFSPHPWTLLPLNAAVFAFGGVALYSILKQLVLDDNDAIISLLPYLFFPSALVQYAQIHKDVFVTTGLLVFVWVCVQLMGCERRLLRIVLVTFIGIAALTLVSVFRPYLMIVLYLMTMLLMLWSLVGFAYQFFKYIPSHKRLGYPSVLLSKFLPIAALSIITLSASQLSTHHIVLNLKQLSFYGNTNQNITQNTNQNTNQNTTQNTTQNTINHFPFKLPFIALNSNINLRSADSRRIFFEKDVAIPNVFEKDVAILNATEHCRPVVVLKEDAFLENALNRVFLKIAVAREGFTGTGRTTAASNIDNDINFCTMEDLIRYIPRAIQIAFFSPFPSGWLVMDRRNSSPIEIYISAVEMFYCYIAFLGLFYWLIRYSKWSVALVVPITLAIIPILLLGLTIANVGTLYRMRFPYLMIFVTFGMAGILQFVKTIPIWVKHRDSND